MNPSASESEVPNLIKLILGGVTKKGFFVTGLFFFIFLFAVWTRCYTFFLPHWQGDQSQYVALACKLETQGYGDFNLMRLGIQQMVFAKFPDWQYVFPVILETNAPGDFFKAYDRFGIQFNKLPLYHKSPLFPAVLCQSHRLLANPMQPYGVFKTKSDFVLTRMPYDINFMQAQFWAAVVPFFFSLLVIGLTFCLGSMLFNCRIGLIAMLLQTIHPVTIVTSYKLLSDDLASFFVILSVLLFYYGMRKKSGIILFVGGISHGYAILAKQSSLLVMPALWMFILLTYSYRLKEPKTWLNGVFNRNVIIFFLGSLFFSYHWFELVYSVYGNAFFQPEIESTFTTDKTGWFKYVLESRPQALWLFIINIPLFCPPFVFGHMTIFPLVRKIFSIKVETPFRNQLLFLWLWVLSFLMFFVFRIESREERYLLPVYPALAILTAFGIESTRKWLIDNRAVPKGIVNGTFALFFILTVLWSVPIALENVFWQRFLILKPWDNFISFYSSSIRMITPWTQ